MSTEITINPERVCYLHCTFCNTVLAVSVPCSRMSYTIATVKCGHCSSLLSVNMGALLQTLPPQPPQLQKQQSGFEDGMKDCGSSSKCYFKFAAESVEQQPRMPPIRRPPEISATLTTHLDCDLTSASSSSFTNSTAPEKRQRVPSAYNRFIKEEIQRIKASNPHMSHREAFSTAAKNWAHFPHIQFGLTRESNKQAKLDHAMTSGGSQRSNPFY